MTSKRSPRFRLDPPIQGHFGSRPVVIYNIGERGIQIEHSAKLPLNTVDRLRFSFPFSPEIVSVQARVVWCRMARHKDVLAAWPYRHGLQLEGVDSVSLDTLVTLLDLSFAVPLPSAAPSTPVGGSKAFVPRASWVPSPPLTLEQSIPIVQSAEREIARLAPSERAALTAATRQHPERDNFSTGILEIAEYLHRVLEPRVIRMIAEFFMGDR